MPGWARVFRRICASSLTIVALVAASPVVVDTGRFAPPSSQAAQGFLPAPVLDPASDTGRSNSDSITRNDTPTFVGTAPPGSTVSLIEGRGDFGVGPGFDETVNRVGSGAADRTGRYAIRTIPLQDGLYSIFALVTSGEDVIGGSSPTLVTIDTQPPMQPNPPRLTLLSPEAWSGIAEPGNIVRLFATPVIDPDAPDAALDCSSRAAPLASATAPAPSGSYGISFTAPPGINVYCVTHEDVAGNVSAPSSGPPVMPGDAGKGGGSGGVPSPSSFTVQVGRAAGQATPTGVQPINFLATFSDLANGFAAADVTIDTGGCGSAVSTVTPLDPATLTPLAVLEPVKKFNIQVVLTATSCSRVVFTASIPANRAMSPTGVWNSASMPASSGANVITYDRPALLDTTGPNTTLFGLPLNPSSRSVTFGFSSEAGSKFECNLDGAGFVPCTSPKHYENLAPGSHAFSVHAKDLADNVGPDMPSAGPFTWIVTDDQDADGLADQWETAQFVMAPGPTGLVRVDLPNARSDRTTRKTLFLHIDWMQDSCASQKPSYDAIKLVWTAFNARGIDLIVDLGEDSPLDYSYYTYGMSYGAYTGPKWETALSKAGPVTYVNTLGSLTDGRYNWTQPPGSTAIHFDNLKTIGRFAGSGREHFYRYVVFAHKWETTGSSGLSRGRAERGASDLIVSLGASEPATTCVEGGTTVYRGRGTPTLQASTLMHELGHGLGLEHGGDEPLNDKPNYLSVMNYAYQLTGLTRFDPTTSTWVLGFVDYSDNVRASVLALDENDLSEPAGLGPNAAGWGAYWACPFGIGEGGAPATGFLNWNCFAPATEVHLSTLNTNINRDYKANTDINCVGPGADGGLQTVPNAAATPTSVPADDYRHRLWVRGGDNRICDTAATADDALLAALGVVNSPNLYGFDDWAAIDIRRGGMGQGFFAGAPPSTEPEDRDMWLRTKDRIRKVPVRMAPAVIPRSDDAQLDVTIFGVKSPAFDPRTVNGHSLLVGAAKAINAEGSPGDVNEDGLTDVTWTFPVVGAGLDPGVRELCVTGNTATTTETTTTIVPIQGCASVRLADGAPIANNSFVMNEGAVLVVDAPGVLRGDIDPDGDPLTAELASGPASGSLTLNPHGSFVYVAGRSGIYTFTYRARDPTLSSAVATVTITVMNLPPRVERIQGPVDPVRIGSGVVISASFFDAGTADTHSAVWVWGDRTESRGAVSEAEGSGTVAGSHVYTAPGAYTVTLVVFDDDGAFDSAEWKVVVS